MWHPLKTRCAFAVLVALCANGFGERSLASPVPQESSVSADRMQIRISVTTTKKKYSVGEPIIVKLEITNIGKVPVLIGNDSPTNVQQDVSTGAHLDLEIQDAQGQSSPAIGLIADSFGIPSKTPPITTLLGGWLLLRPRSSYKTSTTIDRQFFEFLGKPGIYRLSGAYVAPDLFAPSTSQQLGLTERDLKAIPAPGWSGRLKFRPVTFEIVKK